jgi:hypothetical protein
MASSEEIAPFLPETLPEDFSDWDSEASPAPSPVLSGGQEEWESVHSFGETPRPFGLSKDPDAFLESLLERPHVSGSASSAPVFIKQQKDSFDWDSEALSAPPRAHSGERDAREADHSPDETVEPPTQSADRNATVSPVTDKPRASDSASSAPVFIKQQKNSFDRDGVASEKPLPVNAREWEAWEADHSLGETSKPHGQSADREATVPPVVDGPRVSGSASPASVLVKQQELTNELMDGSPNRASREPDASHAANGVSAVSSWPKVAMVDGILDSPEITATLKREADGALFQMFSSKNFEDSEEQETAKKKWMIVASAGAGSILLLLIVMFSMSHHGTKPAAKQSVQPPPAATDTQQEVSPPSPSSSESSTQHRPPITTQKQQKTNKQPTSKEKGTKPAQAQTEMMNDQLTAPRVISRDAQKPVAEDAPPPASSGAGGADGLGGSGAVVGAFNGHKEP